MSQKNVIKYILDWYNAYYEKKNMKIYSSYQIDIFYKLEKSKN